MTPDIPTDKTHMMIQVGDSYAILETPQEVDFLIGLIETAKERGGRAPGAKQDP